jgi:hypothetical protein
MPRSGQSQLALVKTYPVEGEFRGRRTSGWRRGMARIGPRARGMSWQAAIPRAAVIAGLIVASYVALVVGAILLLAVIVGSSAAVVVLLYGVAHLFMYLFGLSFRWGLVTSCGLLFVCCGVGGLIRDMRLTVMPPEPAERETALPPGVGGRATQPRFQD